MGTPRQKQWTWIVFGVFLTSCLPLTIRADEGAIQKDAVAKSTFGETVKMPVNYHRSMLVVVSEQGVAGVRFLDAFERGNKTGNGVVGVSYEWRFQGREADAKEQTGRGRVFAKLKNGEVQKGTFDVQCGPMSLTWSYRQQKSGVVAFDPRNMSVHSLADNYFTERKGDPLHKPVDLRRFLQAEANSNGSQMGAPVYYEDCAVVVKHPSGLAIFEFGEPFEVETDKEFPHYGIPFHSRFLSPGKPTREHNGEVYEERFLQGGFIKSQLNLEAGPLQMEWSQGDQSLGWIYYAPEQTPVWIVEKGSLETLIAVLSTPHKSEETKPAPILEKAP
ncbi:hypothetical protein Pan258_55960 [Symmachiella dynata]|uniref:hypothetical protein n=1 Tax=Symmachiella dynata TaxID=2527995 RepID=UPI00118A5BB9|nr:hypothetical protein [Symmachiella dynata]QDT51507.1 hypothetical protein Pan258_55960 [Symmachiella dynata]